MKIPKLREVFEKEIAAHDGLGEMRNARPTVEQVVSFIDAFGQHVERAISARDEEIALLKKRIEEIEGGGVRYEGVWQDGKEYRRGTFATRGGSVWHANCTTRGRPGESPDWTLAVKAGRDGRDVR